MKQEEKDLLLKDLCARLPYGVKVQSYDLDDDMETIETLREIDSEGYMSTLECDTLRHIPKPYLFPLSSMTEEQKNELVDLEWSFDSDNSKICNILECFGTYRAYVDHSCCSELIDWFHKNHFDYRGLIPTGLAIDATGLNIY